MSTNPRELEWEIDGLTFQGLEWKSGNNARVLMLHGWMDHAASFQELAPRLEGCHVIAIDLSGQGLSSHRAAHATYNIWDDLPQISDLLEDIGWNDCILVGHSRGANISVLFAAVMPEKVQALVALDSLSVVPSELTFVQTLRNFMDQTRSQKAKSPRVFATIDEYLRRRISQGNSELVSNALAPRALQAMDNGFALRGDKRMFASSAVKLSQQDIDAVLGSIHCPVLNIWASEGIRYKSSELDKIASRAKNLIEIYESVELIGDHHFHLEPKTASEIAETMIEFLNKHNLL